MDPTFKTIIRVVVILVVIIWLINALGLMNMGPHVHLR
jgi:hypothetical protein